MVDTFIHYPLRLCVSVCVWTKVNDIFSLITTEHYICDVREWAKGLFVKKKEPCLVGRSLLLFLCLKIVSFKEKLEKSNKKNLLKRTEISCTALKLPHFDCILLIVSTACAVHSYHSCQCSSPMKSHPAMFPAQQQFFHWISHENLLGSLLYHFLFGNNLTTKKKKKENAAFVLSI